MSPTPFYINLIKLRRRGGGGIPGVGRIYFVSYDICCGHMSLVSGVGSVTCRLQAVAAGAGVVSRRL